MCDRCDEGDVAVCGRTETTVVVDVVVVVRARNIFQIYEVA